jgi:polysaccharide pyruvyl transferase WcaK-like protein
LGCVGVKLGYCPTIFLSDLNSNLARLPDAEVPGVLISIRTPSLMNIPLRLQSNIQAEIESIIDDLRSRGFGRIRILCNDSRDIEFATVFQGTKKVDYVYTADVYGYLSLLKEAELVISYRLHASLPCLSFGTPVVMLSYDERASSLIEDLGFGDWDINLTEGSTIKNVQSRLDNIDNLTELRKKTNALWDSISDIQHKEMKNFSEEVVSYARSSHAIYSKF